MLFIYVGIVVVFAVFGVSTIPGVRPKAGYNLFLDGMLNNLAYALSPILCFLRARKRRTYRSSWRILAVGLALYGLGNIYWTIFIRPMAGPAVPSVADGFWLSFYPCAFIALLARHPRLRRQAAAEPLARRHRRRPRSRRDRRRRRRSRVLKAVHANGDSTAAIVTTEAYPLLDVMLLLVVTALLALLPLATTGGLWFLAGGLAMFSVADCRLSRAWSPTTLPTRWPRRLRLGRSPRR